MVVLDNINLSSISSLLLEQNTPHNLLYFILFEIIFWVIVSFLLVQFMPKRFKQYKKEVFLFFVVINVGLLYIGILLTLIMMMFGLSWATHRESQPDYETVFFEDHLSEFPLVNSKFQEGILTIDGEHTKAISTDEKIKSLRILYDSNAEGNIGKIKKFLADSSDETRLYAFALISSFEKKLNTQIKNIQEKIESSSTKKERNQHLYELALTYWQFIFHGVASDKLSGFYTKKIEKTLEQITEHPRAYVLLGKIHLFNKNYQEAEEAFLRAVELGIPKEAIFTFLAEIRFEQQKYNEVSNYISNEHFEIDIRLKPLAKMWSNA